MYACQTCLGYESEIDLIQICDLKRRPFFSLTRIWSPIFAHINTIFLWVDDDLLFCWKSNCEDCTGEVVGPLFTWTNLNIIANLIKERGINYNYDSILTIGSFIKSKHPSHGNEAKTVFNMAQTLMMKELDVTLVETLSGSVMRKQSFRRLESISTWFGCENTICHSLQ